MAEISDPSVSRIVADAVASLVGSDLLNGRFRVSLPLVMPSGSLLDVSVHPEPGGSFMVCDDGAAFAEVLGYGVNRRQFASVAKLRAQRVGAIYDGESLLFLRVPSHQLRLAIIEIGNLARDVAVEAVEHSLRARHENERDILFARIAQAFPGLPVTHEVEVTGASTASYKFDALLERQGGNVLFELFTRDAVSVAATYTKLSDVSRADESPRLVGVTRDPNAIGPKLTLLSSVARVVPINATSNTYIRAAGSAAA